MSKFILSDMREALNSVRPLLSKVDDVWKKYHIENGQVKAQNRNMRAGAPLMFDESFIVPALDFDKAVKAFHADPEVLIGPKQLVFKAGKSRVTLPRLSTIEEIKVEELDGETIELDTLFMENIKKLFPLIESSDNPSFQNTIICVKGTMVATLRGRVIVSCDYEPFEKLQCLLPLEVIKFLVAKKIHPEKMILTKNGVQFIWEDGSWVISSLFKGNVPKVLFEMMNSIGDPEWEPDKEHYEAIADVIAVGAEMVFFTKDGTEAKLTHGEFNTDTLFPLPEEGKSIWNPKHLQIIMGLGDTFDFTTWPQPAKFKGEGVRGVCAPMLG